MPSNQERLREPLGTRLLGVLKTLPVVPKLRLPPLAVFTRREAGTRTTIVEAMTDALRGVNK